MQRRTDAVLIKVPEGRTYADLFKEIADKTNKELTNIKKVRKSMSGDLLIELTEEGNTTALKEMINNATGDNKSAKALTDTIDIELKYFDPIIEKEEVKIEFL